MEGNGYITYDLRSESIATKINHITLSFKTFHPSGLLVHGSGSQGDFITIELVHGQIRFTINLGSTKTISGKHTVIIGDNLSDNKWHEVRVDRNQRAVVLQVDEERNQTTTPGSFVSLDLDRFLFIGGLERSSSGNYGLVTAGPGFIGCMKNLYFDHTDIFYGAKDELFDYETHGFVRFVCPNSEYVPVNFPSPDTHLKLSRHSPKKFTVDLFFRTYDGNGVLVYKQSNNSRVYLKIASGSIELEIRVGTDKPIRISEGDDLHDGMWHHVIAGVSGKDLWLKLDTRPELRHENPWLSSIGDFRSRVYIGYGTQNEGFVGCMHRIKLNGNPVNLIHLSGSKISGAVINHCGISSKCFPNPCRNEGQCFQTWRAFSCDCEGTFYHGARCESPLYRATCQEYKALGMVHDAYCQVDPDGTGPLRAFTVMCNMSASEAAMTVVTHDKQGKHRVSFGAAILANQYFQRITYGSNLQLNLASIRALIERSSNCKQYIRYDCFNSTLLNSPVGPEHVQWLSSTYVRQNYWGGAPSGSNKCKCGVTKTCEDPSKFCNCDAANDNRWRQDSGYLTDKSALPVTMLQFTSDAVHSFFTLGPLECLGSSGQKTSEVPNANFISSACRLVNPPPTIDVLTGISRLLSTTHGTKRKTSITSPGRPREKDPSKHQVTMTTTIATNKNSTLVTSVLSHETKSEGVTVHSSITKDKSGVTVHSSITTEGKTVTLPPVTTVEPKSPKVMVITNGSVSYITHVKGQVVYDARFIILVSSSVLAFIILICVIIFVFLKRSGRRYVCCISCKSCGRKTNIPDIEVYRHTVPTESPDAEQLEGLNRGAEEFGAYNVSNGQTVYHSVHRDSHVRKYVSFSASTSKL